MEKKLLVTAALTTGIAGLALAGRVYANEGIIQIRPVEGKQGECFASSMYIEGDYQIMVTCRDLRMAYSADRDKYVLWRDTGENNKPTSEGVLTYGKLRASTHQKFNRLFITAERSSDPEAPSSELIATGDIQPLPFISNPTTAPASPTPTPSRVITEDQTDNVLTITPAPTVTGNRFMTVLGNIGKAILLGFILLLVVVGVLGFLARRRGL